MRRLFFLLIIGFAVSACVQSAVDNNNASESPAREPATDQSTPVMDDPEPKGVSNSEDEVNEASMQRFNNKAVGYSIDIPLTWYWRHYIKPEIVEQNPIVDDFLFVSPTHAIAGFATEQPAEIVVELSSRRLSEYEESAGDLDRSSVMVGGKSATRYSGIRNNNVTENAQVIEYHMTHSGKSLRIFYRNSADSVEVADIFERMVKSISFGE